MKHEKNIYIIIAILLFITLSGNIYGSVQSYKYRRFCNQYREQLVATEEANKELTDRIGECKSITNSIGELCERNVSSAREIIELTEELRSKVYELENCLGSFSQLEYYQYWDNEFGIGE